MTAESWVGMKRRLFWTNEAFSCSAISKIHCENVTIYLHYLCTQIPALSVSEGQNAAEI